jgi:hypothetical protein
MITNGRQAVTATANIIDGRSSKYSRLYIHNDDNTKDLFIGGPGVTITNGLRLLKSESTSFELPPLTDIYVVSDGSSHNLSWMRVEIG